MLSYFMDELFAYLSYLLQSVSCFLLCKSHYLQGFFLIQYWNHILNYSNIIFSKIARQFKFNIAKYLDINKIIHNFSIESSKLVNTF